MTDITNPTTSPDAPVGASGEVRAKRRTFSAAEKLRILREAAVCTIQFRDLCRKP